MNLLDATLAFALTMGALATIATVLMESFHRAIRIRKRNLLDVMRRLNAELGWLDESQRWDFVRRVLNNPAARGHGLPEALSSYEDSQTALDRLGWRDLQRGVYDEITIEHVLRRLSEVPAVRTLVQTQRAFVEAELDRISRRFQEIRAGVSADFKRRAQLWSMVAGVLLAVLANIDGVRIFDAYKNDPALSARIIAKQEDFEAAMKAAEADRAAFAEARAALGEAWRGLDAARSRQPLDPSAVTAAQEALDAAAQRVDALSREKPAGGVEVGDLAAMGVPIGPAYWPFGAQDAPEQPAFTDYLQWAVKVVLSGLLLGLGAPFWFDVAKRLSQVRTAFGGTPSSEKRMAGKDALPDVRERRDLVATIVDDAQSDAAADAALRPPDATIRLVQQALHARGLLDDPAREDGVLGPRTRVAAEEFLRAQGITGSDRTALLGDWSSPDFVPKLLGLLEDAGG